MQDNSDGKPLFGVQLQSFHVTFKPKIGFEMGGTPHGFVILTSLVEGFIRQQDSYSQSAPSFKITAKKQEDGLEGRIVQVVRTDKNGRYQFD